MSDLVRAVHTEWFTSELKALPAAQRARVVARVHMLERKGWTISLKDDDIEELEDGIYELKVRGRGPAYRPLFFVAPGNPGRLVVLTNCVAKGILKKGRVRRGQIARAKNRRDEWLKRKNGNDA
jgi:phage-related protein